MNEVEKNELKNEAAKEALSENTSENTAENTAQNTTSQKPQHLSANDRDLQFAPKNPEYTVILFYKYTAIKNPEGFMKWMKELGQKLTLTGRVLIATEGINATLEGKNEAIDEFLKAIKAQDGSEGTWLNLSDLEVKTSVGTGVSFRNLKVKVRAEIVALKLSETEGEDVDPNQLTGIHLEPEELRSWYENGEDFIVVDMRNDYEFRVGRFKNSIMPPMVNFRELPEALPKVIEKIPNITEKRIITACTGGVRCEKASGYLLKKGFKNVYQLHGGMHKYMEKYPGKDFEGGLFTFDNRVVMDFSDPATSHDIDSTDTYAVAHTGHGTQNNTNTKREIIGTCDICGTKTERFDNCKNDECHKHMLVCNDCASKHMFVWCSETCRNTGRIGLTRFKDMPEVTGAIALDVPMDFGF